MNTKPRECGPTENPSDLGGLNQLGGQRTGHAEQQPGEVVRQARFVLRKLDGPVVLFGDVGVEQQDVAVLGGQGAQFLRRLPRIAVRRMAVGDVDDEGRVATRMFREKGLENVPAWASAAHMGVLPAGWASNQTGNLNFRSTRPPARSSTMRDRVSTRRGLPASLLTGTRVSPARGPRKADCTRLP